MSHHLVLTVGDHTQNGFISLARFAMPSLEAARAACDEVNALIDPDSVDIDTDDYTFILDIWEVGNNPKTWGSSDNSNMFSTQIAMRLAPDQVQEWLAARPDPNEWPTFAQDGPWLAWPLTQKQELAA